MPDEPQPRRDFATVYRETVAPLRRYLARLLGNATEAQDVAHDAYLRVYPEGDRTNAHQPEAVLYTTARRLAINRLKRRSISPVDPEGAAFAHAASTSPGVAQQVMARQELQMLETAIARTRCSRFPSRPGPRSCSRSKRCVKPRPTPSAAASSRRRR